MNNLTIGIDATNLRQGGGRTHLIELLRTADPTRHDFVRIVVWGSQETLALLDNRKWLIKRNPSAQEKSLLSRLFWQRFKLSDAARREGCNILFVPGGSFAGNFHPVVTMSQNLLPFELCELKRYGWTILTLKFYILRIIQGLTFKKSTGIIFLSDYAKNRVEKVTGYLSGKTTVIPHGLSHRFLSTEECILQKCVFNGASCIRLIYVSTVDVYKHQWHVVEAVAKARKLTGIDLQLDLIGPAYQPALDRLKLAIAKHDPEELWVQYLGATDYNELHSFYAEAHIGIFASTCENLPITLLETMASGLAVLCSDRGAMPEVMGDAGLYFDPENPDSLASALMELLSSTDTISKLASVALEKSKGYTWERCASDTFTFLSTVSEHHRKINVRV